MILIVTLVISLVLWVVLWGIGAKALDAFMLSIVLMLTAAAAHIVLPMLPGNRRRDDD
jgi:hypothetical protein